MKVDVLSCAAPNLSGACRALREDELEELYQIHVKRGKAILDVALASHVDVMVLGAFGCGAFNNDPHIVAKAYKSLLEEYSKYFTEIEFSIYCSKYDSDNYEVFKSIIK